MRFKKVLMSLKTVHKFTLKPNHHAQFLKLVLTSLVFFPIGWSRCCWRRPKVEGRSPPCCGSTWCSGSSNSHQWCCRCRSNRWQLSSWYQQHEHQHRRSGCSRCPRCQHIRWADLSSLSVVPKWLAPSSFGKFHPWPRVILALLFFFSNHRHFICRPRITVSI